MSDIIRVLERLGQLEWYGVRPADLNTISLPIPMVTFRYSTAICGTIIDSLKQAIESFPSEVDWRLYCGTKNMTIAPQMIADQRSDDSAGFPSLDRAREIASDDPDVALLVAQSYVALIQHLDATLPNLQGQQP